MSFKKSLEASNSLLGTLLTIPEPAVAEILSKVGLDWVFIDAEHSSMSSSDVLDLLRALGEGCYGLVRVAENSDVEIKKALDAGADGVIIPLVNTKEEAERAVTITWMWLSPCVHVLGESVGNVGVPLIRPEKVRGMRKWRQIIVVDELDNPIKAKLIPYFKRKQWSQMADKNPYLGR